MPHVIYRGPVVREPETVNLPVATAALPGTFVVSDLSELTVADDATARLLVLSNRRFMDQTDEDAYEAGETAVAYRAEPDQEYRVRMAAGAYTPGQALTVNGSGQAAAASSGNVIVAYLDQAGATFTANELGDVVLASRVAAA
jgi:hypothetical protein